MKRHIALVFLLSPPSRLRRALDAQVGGLLRKKAGEVLGKKPEPAKPATAPAPAPATETAPATPAPAPADTGARTGRVRQPRGGTGCAEEGSGIAARPQRVAAASSRPIRCFASASTRGQTAIGISCRTSRRPRRRPPTRLSDSARVDARRHGRLGAEDPRDVGGVPGRARRLHQERAPGRRPRPQGRGHLRRGDEEERPQADRSHPGSHDGRDDRRSGADRCPPTC